MEQLQGAGAISQIVVSNFTETHLAKLVQSCNVPPQFNQIEVHPLYMPKGTIKFCREHKIQVMSYTPLSNGKTGFPAADVLAWHDLNGFTPIPHTQNLEHLEENTMRTQLTQQ